MTTHDSMPAAAYGNSIILGAATRRDFDGSGEHLYKALYLKAVDLKKFPTDFRFIFDPENSRAIHLIGNFDDGSEPDPSLWTWGQFRSGYDLAWQGAVDALFRGEKERRVFPI